jgi:hypothetical protein
MVYFALVLLSFSFVTPAISKDIYKWVDQDGRVHFTDNPALIPEDKLERVEVIEGQENESEEGQFAVVKTSPAVVEEENVEPEFDEQNRNEQALRDFWRSQALEIENKEKAIIAEIDNTEKQIDHKKREVDYLLLNGYFADRSILELRYLESYLQELNSQLILLAEERENLADEARRQGIPPGYLRR